jgi:hypothetical protein
MVISSKDKVKVFAQFLYRNGFSSLKSKNVLEIGSRVEDSLTHFLKEDALLNLFLLSSKVDYDELEKLGIRGANGYLDHSGIVVPQSSQNDIYYTKHGLVRGSCFAKKYMGIPTIEDFDTIISSEYTDDLKSIDRFNGSIYVGTCTEDDTYENEFQDLFAMLSASENKRYTFTSSETVDNLRLTLIKRG